jgi:hypothetical protein
MDNSFKDREQGMEAKFAHDLEVEFRIHAHRDRLFAAWVADQMSDSAPPDYADTLLEFAFGRAQGDLIAKALQDLHNHGIALADTKIQKAYDQCGAQAETEA